VRCPQSREREHQGAFSRRIRADETDDLAGVNGQVHIVQDLDRSVKRVEILTSSKVHLLTEICLHDGRIARNRGGARRQSLRRD
jgi:hypothetical protein